MSINNDYLDWTRHLVRGISGAGSPATSFTVTAAGPVADVSAFNGSVARIPMTSGRGGRIFFLGQGAANDTYNYRLLGCDRPIEGQSGFLTHVGSGVTTLGTGTGLNFPRGELLADDLIADTLTWVEANSGTSPKGVGDLIGGATPAYGLGQITAYSPADNTPAMLIIPHFPFHELWVDFDMDTGDPSAGNILFIRTN